MRKLNPEHKTALIEMVNKASYFDLLGIKLVDMDMGSARFEVDLQKRHMNPFGAIHGGIYASIIDTAAYWSAYCEVEENVGFTSIDLNVNNLAMVKSGKIIVTGRCIRVGKTLIVTEGTAEDESGRMLAYGTSKLMVLHGRQTMVHAVEYLQSPNLPPKFID
jgi:uncharacterized protein (TIGR00369 family)